jgi:hypothetical protein
MHPLRSLRLTPTILLLCVVGAISGLLLCGFIGLVFQLWSLPVSGVSAWVGRGGRIVVVRPPTTSAPVRQLEVFNDGLFVLSQAEPPALYQEGRLSPEQWQGVVTARQQWCRSLRPTGATQARSLEATAPPLRATEPPADTPRYTIGVLCPDNAILEVRLIQQDVPPELHALLQALPPEQALLP